MKDDVLICFLDVGELADADMFKERYEGLSDARREKIDRLRRPEDRRRALGAGLLLDYGLRPFGLSERDARIRYGPNGKPYLKDRPDLFFNLSHSGNLAMAVFAGTEVGCDVERIRPGKERVARRFFCREECRWMEEAENVQTYTERFFRLWTLKESFLKADGRGMALPMDTFCFLMGADGVRVRQSEDAGPFTFREIRVGDCRAAVCVHADVCEFHEKWLTIKDLSCENSENGL